MLELAQQLHKKAQEYGICVLSDFMGFEDCINLTREEADWGLVMKTGVEAGLFAPPLRDSLTSVWGKSEPIRYWTVLSSIPEDIEEQPKSKPLERRKELIKELNEFVPPVVNQVVFKDIEDSVNAKSDLLSGEVVIRNDLPWNLIPGAFFEEVGHLVDPRPVGETTEGFAKWYRNQKLKEWYTHRKYGAVAGSYPLNLLNESEFNKENVDINIYGQYLYNFLVNYRVNVNRVVPINLGPRVMRFQVFLNVGAFLSSVESLKEEMAVFFGVNSVAVFTSEGKLLVDIPRKDHDTITLKLVLASKDFVRDKGKIPLVFGVNQDGTPLIPDLDSMPHLLIAGATQSGKSVFLHSIICGLMYRFTPVQLKLHLIDLKRVEFSLYKGIPYGDVHTTVESAIVHLNSLVGEMDRRYKILEDSSVRDVSEIDLPYIVTVIDEIGDLFALGGKKFKKDISMLLRKARAAGIHFITATQRPSADIIPGEVKANLPARVSFKVASHTDSQIILNTTGAEDLLGNGDGLYEDKRFQAPLITTEEIKKITLAVKNKYGTENK